MKTHEKQINVYAVLNKLVTEKGTVIFGGTEDKEIPVLELKQSFAFEENIYNRSFDNLSLYNALEIYKDCIEELAPDSLLLHIGAADIERFEVDSAGFDNTYRNLITGIKKTNKKCIISVIPIKNQEQSPVVSELNRHLEMIAESEQCYFCDINTNGVWNPKAIREIVSFLSTTGFVRPLKRTTPNYDLIKVLFCYNENVGMQQAAACGDKEQGEIVMHPKEPIVGTI